MKRALAALAGAGMAALIAGSAAAADAVTLFKVVSMKDDVVIGVTAAELEALGKGAEIEVIAKALDERSVLVVWQYAPTRAADGSPRETPIRRIALYANNLIRIEPYKAVHPVVAPQ
jgi:hypothetical protein